MISISNTLTLKVVEYEGFTNFPIIYSPESYPFDIEGHFGSVILVDIKAAHDFIMVPGEARYINTMLKFITGDKTSIICETPPNLLFKTKLRAYSSTVFRNGDEDSFATENFKFILHNTETPISYPVRIPGDVPRSMDSNKIKLVSGEQVPVMEITNGLVAANSYLIKKDDVIARLLITKL